jgi:hypothetical protein
MRGEADDGFHAVGVGGVEVNVEAEVATQFGKRCKVQSAERRVICFLCTLISALCTYQSPVIVIVGFYSPRRDEDARRSGGQGIMCCTSLRIVIRNASNVPLPAEHFACLHL